MYTRPPEAETLAEPPFAHLHSSGFLHLTAFRLRFPLSSNIIGFYVGFCNNN